MSFFNNYTKPGKGIEKDETRPNGFIMFFTLLGRKLGFYIKMNLLYFLTCIPSIITFYFVISTFAFNIGSGEKERIALVSTLSLALSLCVVMVFGLSPFSSGFYYILRNFAREEHSWISDFGSVFKDNMKSSLLTWVIDSLFVFLGIIALRVYYILSSSNIIFLFFFFIMVLFMIIYALSVPYRWTTLVTFENTLMENYKNSLFFVMGGGFRTFLQLFFLLLWVAVVVIGSYFFDIIAYLILALIGLSAYGLIQAIILYPVILKYTSQNKEE